MKPFPKSRPLRRLVQPFDDLYVNVDLYTLVSDAPAAPLHLERVIDRIEANSIDLQVISLMHAIPKAHLKRLNDPMFVLTQGGSGGSPRHHALAALSVLYLESVRKYAIGDGNCRYDGGLADVAATDGSMFVECGRWPAHKLADAMKQGIGFVSVPYVRKTHVDPLVAARLRTDSDVLLDRYDVERPVLGYFFRSSTKMATLKVESRTTRGKAMKSTTKQPNLPAFSLSNMVSEVLGHTSRTDSPCETPFAAALRRR